MLVTFRSKAHSNITMFGDVAIKLLKLMGHSGTVPSALVAAEIPAALARLRQGIAEQHPAAAATAPAAARSGDDAEPAVTLPARALPLIQLLEAAAADGADVVWDS